MKLSGVAAGFGVTMMIAGFGLGLSTPYWAPPASALAAGEVDRHLIPLDKHLWIIYTRDTPESRAAVSPEVWKAHLAFDLEQEKNGTRVIGGAVSDVNDKREYGMFIIRAKDAEEAMRIAKADPAVQAGERTVDIHQYEVHEGSMTFTVNFHDSTASFR